MTANVDVITNKMPELATVLQLSQIDIATLTEICPKNSRFQMTEDSICPSGYNIFSNLSDPNCRRGVAVLASKEFQVKEISVPNYYLPWVEATWVSLSLPNEMFVLSSIYRSPSSPCQLSSERAIAEMTQFILCNYPKATLLMTGDFNLPNVSWVDGQGMTKSSLEQNPLVQALSNNFLYQTVTMPTRMRPGQNPSILDLVITNDPEKVINTHTLSPIGSSDHMPVLSSIQLNSKPSKYTKQSFTNYKMMVEELLDANLETLISEDVEASWLTLKKTLLESQAKHTSITWKKKPKTLPFLTPKIKKLRNRKKKLWEKYMKQKTTALYEQYKTARNLLRKETRKLTSNYKERLAKNVKENPKLFWKYISHKKPGRHTVPDLVNNNSLSSCPSEKANLLNQQFASVFSMDDPQSTPPPAEQAHTPFPMVHSPVTIKEVTKQLKDLDPNKSTGPDGLSPRLMKELSPAISAPLVKLFNLSLAQGKLPGDWKKGIVIPIHKKGSKTSAANYRPISLTCVACKVMERIINKRIINHLEANSLISSSQHGFRSKRSVDTNLLESYSLVTDLLERGLPVDIILLDLAKAFDKVCHRYLIHRLLTLSVSPQVVSWTEDFLRDRTQQVKVITGPNSHVLSDEIKVTSGVPQGSVLGPTLFNIYINELPLITSNKTTLYADDSKLIGPANTSSSIQSLQTDLNHMCSWVKRWLLEFNAEKCKVIHFGHKNPKHQYLMTQNSGSHHTIEPVQEESDLGVIVDSQLKFSSHSQKISANASRALGIIKHSITSRSKHVITKLYKGLVRPRLEVGTILATPRFKKDKAVLEQIQRRATKMIAGMENKTYSERLKELNLPSLVYRRKRGDMIQAHKLLSTNRENEILEIDTSHKTRGHPRRIRKHHATTGARCNFFSNRIENLWNNLKEDTVAAESTDAFKRHLDAEWKDTPWKFDWEAPESSTRT